jgi:glycosyltransferase involved in cell wall biosynthesis
LDRLTWDGVTAWMSTSRAATEAYIARLGAPAHKIFTIPTGIADRPVADDAARTRARKRFKLDPDDRPALGVVANLRAAKGYEDLIDALVKLKSNWPRIVCLCAGRDDSAGRIPELARARGVEANMRFLGYVPDAPTVYDAADVAVLASHWEGMPHALIEALRAGRASVATKVGGIGEIIRHESEGLLCPAKSPPELAAAIARALEDEPVRAEWERNARARFESDFRVELMVERMTLLYEYVLGRGPRPGF